MDKNSAMSQFQALQLIELACTDYTITGSGV
jgi:hypothetical protein